MNTNNGPNGSLDGFEITTTSSSTPSATSSSHVFPNQPTINTTKEEKEMTAKKLTLEKLENQIILCVTNDGRTIVGKFRGSDQYLNIILSDAHERIYSLTSGVEQEPKGLYMIKGDNLAMFGELDEEKEMQIDLSLIRGTDFKPVNHGRKTFF